MGISIGTYSFPYRHAFGVDDADTDHVQYVARAKSCSRCGSLFLSTNGSFFVIAEDQDYHLVITDDALQFTPGGNNSQVSPHSFIAEIVNPDCVPGKHGSPSTTSRFQNQIAAVRSAFEQQFPSITGGWNDAEGIPVRITGVAFFDRPHGQVGRANNGLEIHPILEITFNPGTTPTPPTPPTPAATLIENPSFEDGAQRWVASSGVITKESGEPARSGSWKAWLGGYGSAHTDTLYQQVTIPSDATTATLTFYLHISTEEATSDPYDTLKLQVRSSSGQFRKNLATYTNAQAGSGFHLKTIDLSQYRGQTIRIHFMAQEDNGSMTSFVLDDFRIVIE